MVKIWLKCTHRLLEEMKAVLLVYAARYANASGCSTTSLTLLVVEISLRGHHPSKEELVDFGQVRQKRAYAGEGLLIDFRIDVTHTATDDLDVAQSGPKLSA